MTIKYKSYHILLERPEDRADYGVARAKSLAFDAVHGLWRKRKAEGRTQSELASTLGKDEGWLSRNLRGPGNWTIKTLGEMVEALDGELEIIVHPIEDVENDGRNKDPIIDALRTLVEDSGLSWEQISELSGVSATTLYNWFQGATISPRFCTLEAVARSLGASLQFGRRGVNVIPLKRVAR